MSGEKCSSSELLFTIRRQLSDVNKADRITFIPPSGDSELTIRGDIYTFSHGGIRGVKMLKAQVPDWEQLDMEVVVAYHDGSVASSFSVDEMSSTIEHPSTGRQTAGVYRVYRGYSSP